MVDLTIEWARDVAQVLHRRNIGDSGPASSRELQQLLHALLSAPPPSSWIQVARQIEGIDGASVKRKSLQRRAQRAREVLTRASAGLNTDKLKGSAQFRFHTRATNELTTAQLLQDAGFHASARLMYMHALEISLKYELTDCAIRALKSIRRIDAANGHLPTLKAYDRQLSRLRRVQELEHDAESLQDQARALLENFSRNQSRATKQFHGIIARLTQLSHREDATALIYLTQFRCQLWLAGTIRDSRGILIVGRQAVEYLNAHPFAESIAYRVEFEGSRMTAMLAVGDFEGATAVWNDISPRLTEGAANWVQLLQIYFLACTVSRRYSVALDVLRLYETKCKTGGPKWRVQRWQLNRAYMLFLIDEGIVEAGPFQGAPRIFAANLEKQIKQLADDKSVSGPAVFILKILQWLRSRRYTDIVDQVEAMRQYAYRYLSNNQTVRSGVFLRMLATIPAANFDPAVARMRGRSVWDRHIEAHHLDIDSAEIVPYDELWDIAMTILERNLEHRRR